MTTPESPALSALRRAGYAIDQLAGAAGTAERESIAELAGRRALSDATLEAMRGLLSPHLTEAIAALAGASRAEYLQEVRAGSM
ncbi:MAG: hypothetical protein ACXW1Y_02110 [Acidimicrobiia bacterium]